MGGLRKQHMPITFWCFFAATLAIAGCPFTSGFFSKDEILFRSFVDTTVNPFTKRSDARHHLSVYVPPATPSARSLFVVGLLAADDDRLLHVPRPLPDVLRRLPRLDDRSPVAPRGQGAEHHDGPPIRTTRTTRKT